MYINNIFVKSNPVYITLSIPVLILYIIIYFCIELQTVLHSSLWNKSTLFSFFQARKEETCAYLIWWGYRNMSLYFMLNLSSLQNKVIWWKIKNNIFSLPWIDICLRPTRITVFSSVWNVVYFINKIETKQCVCNFGWHKKTTKT